MKLLRRLRAGSVPLLLALGLLSAAGAMAQSRPDAAKPASAIAPALAALKAPAPAPAPASASVAAAAAPCPARATDIPVHDLYGRWQAAFDGTPGLVAAVEFHVHPDYDGGVAGSITRGGVVAHLAGDIGNDGLLALDESLDGVAISASWTAELQAGSCGKEFKGLWRNVIDDNTRSVVLRKAAYWN